MDEGINACNMGYRKVTYRIKGWLDLFEKKEKMLPYLHGVCSEVSSCGCQSALQDQSITACGWHQLLPFRGGTVFPKVWLVPLGTSRPLCHLFACCACNPVVLIPLTRWAGYDQPCNYTAIWKEEEIKTMNQQGARVSQYQLSEGMIRSEWVLPLLVPDCLWTVTVQISWGNLLCNDEGCSHSQAVHTGCCGSPLGEICHYAAVLFFIKVAVLDSCEVAKCLLC